jgi:hypothetical protein
MEKKAKRAASPGKRKIHIDGQVWTYTVGRQHVKVCDPKGARTYVLYLGDRDDNPRITPSMVSDAIKVECLGIPAKKVQHERTMIQRRETLDLWSKKYPCALSAAAQEKFLKTGRIESEDIRSLMCGEAHG